jgi:predicted Zn-dependent protease
MLNALDRIPTTSAEQRRDAADLIERLRQKRPTDAGRNGTLPAKDNAADSARNGELALERSSDASGARRGVGSKRTSDGLMLTARMAKERGDIATALKALKQASELEPEREESYLEYSRICADHDSDPLALEAAEIGLEHLPDSYGLRVQKGVVLEKLGRLSDAESTLRSAVGMPKDDGLAQLSLAVVLAHAGKPEQADKILVDATKQYPDNYYMHYFRGKLLLQLAPNAPEGSDLKLLAERALQESIRLNPRYADSYYQLATIYEENSAAQAEDALSKCLKLDPHHIPAQYALARLYVRTGRRARGQALIAHLKTQQRAEELKQQKQLRIEVAQD